MDRLDLGHDQVGLLFRNQRAQRGAVEHVDDMAAVRHLHGGRMGVAIYRDHFHGVALQFNRHLLAKLTGAKQKHAQGMVGIRRAKRLHRRLQTWQRDIVSAVAGLRASDDDDVP